MHISYSRVSLYLRCPYAHYLRYVERIDSNRPARPLHFGTDFHKLLEVRSSKKDIKTEWRRIKEEFYAMPSSWQTELGEDYPTDLKQIFQDYCYKWKDAPMPEKTEFPFDIKIGEECGEPIQFVGVIDELYRNADGSIDIGEHKTFSRPPDMNTLVMNTQKSLYCKAAELLWGQLPKQVRWDWIKSTPAKAPVWLESSNRFSTAKSKDITVRSWKRACKEKGITEQTVIEQGDIYKGNDDGFYFRVQQDVYPQMVEDLFKGFIYTCRDLMHRGYENTVKNVTRDCAWCEYRDICMAEMSGANREYVIEKNFIKREAKNGHIG